MDDFLDDVDFALPSTRVGCGYCQLELTTVRRFLDTLSYEHVNDVEVRAELRAAHGFCAHHAWQFLDVTHDSLGAAIIYRDVLGLVLAELSALARDDPVSHAFRRFAPSSRSRDHVIHELATKLRSGSLCPACRAIDIAVAERGQRFSHLCLPHLRTAALSGALGGARLSAAWAQTVRRLRRLATDEETNNRDSSQAWRARAARGSLLDLAEIVFGQPGIRRAPPRAPRPVRRADHLASPPRGGATRGEQGHDCLVCTWESHDATAMMGATTSTLPELVAALIESDDLCTVHAWQAIDLHGGTAEARQHPLLQSHVDWVERRVTRLDDLKECRVCALLEQRAREYCLALEDIIATLKAAQTPTSVGLICLPHLIRTLQLAPSDRARVLVRHLIAPLQRLHVDLSEYIRKEDYRFQGEPKGSEQFAPARALAVIAGPRWLS